MESGRVSRRESVLCLGAVVLAAALGLGLMAHEAVTASATYDETAYLQIAARWWRTGDQEKITRMGSPLTFWKLQQAPVLMALDRLGDRDRLDDPMAHLATLLPIARVGALWVWLVALLLTAFWAHRLYGPRAMAFAAWLFTLSPNLLAHGALVTMEMPLVAASTGVFLTFWMYLKGGRTRDLILASVLAGVAFSCKFTAVLFPPILAVCWWMDRAGIIAIRSRLGRGRFVGSTVRTEGRAPDGPHSGPYKGVPDVSRPGRERWARAGLRVAAGLAGFVSVMLLTDWVVTGFAVLPLSPTSGPHPSLDGRFGPTLGRVISRAVETPIPQDWVGFASQVIHQKSGGSSYLLGARRMHGWWYYYFIALAVKAPLSLGLLVLLRVGTSGKGDSDAGSRKAWFLPLVIGLFLAVTAVGSSRNYGVRYLLPVSPVAVVWLSGLANRQGLIRLLAWSLLAVQGLAVASIHPHELSFFNTIAGGPVGGRRVLADSNLDWGQGLLALRRLQDERPETRDLTLYQFGDMTEATARANYGIAGTLHMIDAGDVHPGLPETFRPETPYVAVSASLQWGPWGPPGYFRRLEGVTPVAMTDDATIAVYRTADLRP